MSEENFWSSTPAKIVKLANIHMEINNPNKNKENDRYHNTSTNSKGERIFRSETQTFRKI